MPDRISSQLEGPQDSLARPALALRFISGKYQGGEFSVREGQRIVVGRSSDLDMVLVEEMVSRRHARIEMHDGLIQIEDLGSTNGTFVNGEKVQRAELHEGDRVLIGTSILKVVPATPGGSPSSAKNLGLTAPRGAVPRVRPGSTSDEAPRMTGSIEEIPLPDLLQLFGTSRKSGVLVIRIEGRVGRLYLKAGLIHYAVIDGQGELTPLKAVYRMLTWTRGFFELEPPQAKEFDPALDATVQEVLMEGFRQQDELETLKAKLPPMSSRLALRAPLEAPLHELEPSHLDLLQLALNAPSLEILMDRSSLSDLDTAKVILSLMGRGYLEVR